MSLRLVAGRGAAKLHTISFSLPAGLGFRSLLVSHHRPYTTLRLFGARVASARVRHGRLTLTLQRAVGSLTIRVGGLLEGPRLERRARHHRLHRLRMHVTVVDRVGIRTVLAVLIRRLHL